MSKRSQKSGLDNFKVECARDLNVNLKQGYNGDLSAKEAGSIGGEMVKRMIMDYEQKAKGGQ